MAAQPHYKLNAKLYTLYAIRYKLSLGRIYRMELSMVSPEKTPVVVGLPYLTG